MKPSILITAAIASLILLGATPLAEARSHRGHHSSHVYISGYRSCGTPIYTERYLVRYMRCGSPVWGYRVVAPPRYCPPPRRYYQRPVCPPPYPYSGGYYRSGVVIGGTLRL
jgi:hypothetical protein